MLLTCICRLTTLCVSYLINISINIGINRDLATLMNRLPYSFKSYLRHLQHELPIDHGFLN